MATFADFQKLDIRVGRITQVEDFPEARNPSYKLLIDFGEKIGIKKSCAQAVQNYSREDLLGRLVLCVVNFPSKQISSSISEVLTLGVPDKDSNAILVIPEHEVPLGMKLY